ncbi:Phospholipase/carboxylesterase/thioesterase [Gaertneriomyces semiglobifer]|nr:Phospholipase/carboxylesterase/thioesterase [Gaertneriomyces semiglobifer]
MSTAALKSIIVPATSTHTATVFFLHGLGDSGHGWAPVAKMLQPLLPHIKWILPHAPSRPITINMGMAMPGWYDIYQLSPGGKEDTLGVTDSVSKIGDLIQQEIQAGIPPSRIVLGGFSQGSAVSITYSMLSEQKLAGFACLSGYLPLNPDTLRTKMNDVNKETPMLMCHGDADEVVAYQWGKMSFEKIKELGRNVEFKTYKGVGHSSDMQELRDLAKWLSDVVPQQGAN